MLFHVYIGEDSRDESADPNNWDHNVTLDNIKQRLSILRDLDEGEQLVIRIQRADLT